jgi:hypothetical protein
MRAAKNKEDSMSVKIIYKANTLKKDGSFLPSIAQQSLISQKDLLAYMAKDTALEVRDMRSTLESFEEALKFFLTKGFRIETPLGTFGLRARGTVRSEEDFFRPDEPSSGHDLALLFRPHAELKGYFNQHASIEYPDYPGPTGAKIKRVSNMSAPGAAAYFPGQILEIRGLRMRCDLLHQERDEGLYWIAQDGTEHKAELLIRNTESVIISQVPSLEPGDYRLEVRNRNRHTGLFKELWPETLMIEA